MNKKPFYIAMGDRIRTRRIEMGFTQDALSEKLDISVQTLSETENGKKGLKLTNLVKLCSILDVSIDYIITGREPASTILWELDELTPEQAEYVRSILKSCIKLCKSKNQEND
ncbi:MAG: helix-turn-helix transcriptional regulator [Clostridia bacterium]|nr:helix-turn-helix transcriptional regulator [Clostridia bacterium]